MQIDTDCDIQPTTDDKKLTHKHTQSLKNITEKQQRLEGCNRKDPHYDFIQSYHFKMTEGLSILREDEEKGKLLCDEDSRLFNVRRVVWVVEKLGKRVVEWWTLQMGIYCLHQSLSVFKDRLDWVSIYQRNAFVITILFRYLSITIRINRNQAPIVNLRERKGKIKQ